MVPEVPEIFQVSFYVGHRLPLSMAPVCESTFSEAVYYLMTRLRHPTPLTGKPRRAVLDLGQRELAP
jgi:hypothetical protein